MQHFLVLLRKQNNLFSSQNKKATHKWSYLLFIFIFDVIYLFCFPLKTKNNA
jgi:hypothetical protein